VHGVDLWASPWPEAVAQAMGGGCLWGGGGGFEEEQRSGWCRHWGQEGAEVRAPVGQVGSLGRSTGGRGEETGDRW
jgi:hypothetical protein